MSNYDHDRPNPLIPQDWEYETVTPDGATVLVSKVGGGTLGRYYAGAWHYSYSRRDRHTEGSDLVTGMPHTHADAASLVVDFIEHDVPAVPADWPVQPIDDDDPATDRATCGTCGLSWDDAISTSMTPTPSARCPFEPFHVTP